MSGHIEPPNFIGVRLKSEMKKRGIVSAELARRADVLTSFIYDVISGKSGNPSTVKLAKVADALGVSLNYLVHGDDVSVADGGKSAGKGEYAVIPYIDVEQRADSASVVSSIKEESTYLFLKKWLATSFGGDFSSLRLFCVGGDAMQPTLCHGDIVLVDTGEKIPSPSGVFLLFDGLGITLKRLEYFNDSGRFSLRVISDNKHYPSYECSISDIEIVGRAVWFSRTL